MRDLVLITFYDTHTKEFEIIRELRTEKEFLEDSVINFGEVKDGGDVYSQYWIS